MLKIIHTDSLNSSLLKGRWSYSYYKMQDNTTNMYTQSITSTYKQREFRSRIIERICCLESVALTYNNSVEKKAAKKIQVQFHQEEKTQLLTSYTQICRAQTVLVSFRFTCSTDLHFQYMWPHGKQEYCYCTCPETTQQFRTSDQ